MNESQKIAALRFAVLFILAVWALYAFERTSGYDLTGITSLVSPNAILLIPIAAWFIMLAVSGYSLQEYENLLALRKNSSQEKKAPFSFAKSYLKYAVLMAIFFPVLIGIRGLNPSIDFMVLLIVNLVVIEVLMLRDERLAALWRKWWWPFHAVMLFLVGVTWYAGMEIAFIFGLVYFCFMLVSYQNYRIRD